jgi:hypothetical protein
MIRDNKLLKEQVERLTVELNKTQQEMSGLRRNLAKQNALNANLTAIVDLVQSSNDVLVEEWKKAITALRAGLEEA